MKRWMFNILTCAALLISMLCAFLWARSYWIYDEIDFDRRVVSEGGLHRSYEWLARSERGGILLYHARIELIAFSLLDSTNESPLSFWHGQSRSYPTADLDPDLGPALCNWRLPGFQCLFQKRDNGGNPSGVEQTIVFPHAILFVCASILPALSLRKAVLARRREARKQKLLCSACGYDLRDTPRRCPECGTARMS